MPSSRIAFGLAGLALAASLGAAGPALASGGDPTRVIEVHQDSDGTLWYSWDWDRVSKRFITGRPCWVDHDHIRLGGWGRAGCPSSRPAA